MERMAVRPSLAKSRVLALVVLVVAAAIASVAASASEAAGTARPRVAFMVGGLGNTYLTAQVTAAKKTALKRGLNLDVVAGDWNPATQLNQIQDSSSSGKYKGYVAEVLDGSSTCKLIKSIAEKSPVTVLTAPICNSSPYTKGTVAFAGRMDYQDGVTQAKLVNQALGAAGGEIAVITGPVALTIVKNFTHGFNDQIKNFKAIKVVATPAGNYDPATSLQAAEDVISANPNLKAIVCQADNMCEAAAKAIDSSGKKIVMVGYGGTKGGFDLIKAGKMYGTVMLLPIQEATFAVNALADALQKKPIKQRVYLNKTDPMFKGQGNVVTKANVSQFTAQW